MNPSPSHVERREDAPLRNLAQSVADWRGMSSLKLAELYARRREDEQKRTAAGAAIQQKTGPRVEMDGTLNWLNSLRRWIGIL